METSSSSAPSLGPIVPTIAPAPVTARLGETAIILVAALGHAICHVAELMFVGVLFAAKAEFQLDSLAVMALPLLGWVLLGVGALPVGFWSDAWGPERVMVWYFWIMAVAALMVVFSFSFWMLLLALAGVGLAASIYHPAGLAMVSLSVRPEVRGRAMGINGVAGNFGIAGGPFIGFLAASWGMWRLAYMVLAVLSLLSACLMLLAQRWAVRRMPIGLDGVTTSRVPIQADVPRPLTGKVNWPFVLLLCVMVLGGLNYKGMMTALPILINGAQPEPGALVRGGATFFAIVLLGGCIGQYLGGWAIDRFGAVVYPTLIGSLAMFALLLGAFAGFATPLLAGCLALCLFALQPVENVILAKWTTESRRSLSYAVKFVPTFGLGAFGALATGWAWERCDSTAPVFYSIGGSGMVMVLLFLQALRARRRMVGAR